MTWHLSDGIDTCKSVAMWSLYWPQQEQHYPFSFRFSLLIQGNNFHVFLRFQTKMKFNNFTMGDNLRWSFPFPAPSSDPQACLPDLTRTNSDSSSSASASASGVTIDSFRDPTPNAIPGQSMVWTNDKHNLYLDFLEASFVKQLHCSISLRYCQRQEEILGPCPTQQLPAKEHNLSDQFMVPQDGCCNKINYESIDPLLDSTADSNDILGSTWLHHSASAAKRNPTTVPVLGETAILNNGIYSRSNTSFFCKSETSPEQHPIFYSCNQSFNGGTAEVSDQNFLDEDQEEKTSCMSGAKRLKMTATLDASSNSQVMPLGKLHSVDDMIASDASVKRGKKKLHSEHP